jgi:hypothetical protein
LRPLAPKKSAGIHSLTVGKAANCVCLLTKNMRLSVPVALSNSGDTVGIKTINKDAALRPKIQFSNLDPDCTQYPDLFAVPYTVWP